MSNRWLWVAASGAGLFFLFAGGLWWWVMRETDAERLTLFAQPIPTLTPLPPTATPSPSPSPSPTPVPRTVIQKVPFTSQAPSGQWSNPIFQNACEEASILMAMSWVQGKDSLTVAEAETEIRQLSNLAEELVGTFMDTSAADTMHLLREYYDYDGVEFKENITAEDIKTEIFQGNLVVLPMNGRKLDNPNFTLPGPLEHMLVVIGYDLATDEFITNDPGTRNGRHYRYDTHLFEAAIQDYPTGHHEPIKKTHQRMIVVHKSE